MLVACLLDVRDPEVGQPRGLARHGQGTSHSPAVVVATDDDMLDLEHSNCILQASHAVQVLMGGQVSNVALHKDLAWRQAKNLISLQITPKPWRGQA